MQLVVRIVQHTRALASTDLTARYTFVQSFEYSSRSVACIVFGGRGRAALHNNYLGTHQQETSNRNLSCNLPCTLCRQEHRKDHRVSELRRKNRHDDGREGGAGR